MTFAVRLNLDCATTLCFLFFKLAITIFCSWSISWENHTRYKYKWEVFILEVDFSSLIDIIMFKSLKLLQGSWPGFVRFCFVSWSRFSCKIFLWVIYLFIYCPKIHFLGFKKKSLGCFTFLYSFSHSTLSWNTWLDRCLSLVFRLESSVTHTKSTSRWSAQWLHHIARIHLLCWGSSEEAEPGPICFLPATSQKCSLAAGSGLLAGLIVPIHRMLVATLTDKILFISVAWWGP